MAAKKLPELDKLKKENPFIKPVPTILRTNNEVSSWLHGIFELKHSGELDMTHIDISSELSSFLERDVTPRQVANAYSEWLRKTTKN